MTHFTSVVYKFKQAIRHEELENYINQSSSLWPFLTFRYEGGNKKCGDLYYAVIEDESKSAVLPQDFKVPHSTKCGDYSLRQLPPHRLVKLSNNEQRYVNTCASQTLQFTVVGKTNSTKLSKYLKHTYPNARVSTCVVSASPCCTQYTVQFSNNTKDAVKVFKEAFMYNGCHRRTITFTNGVESLLNQIRCCISEHPVTAEDFETESSCSDDDEQDIEDIEEVIEEAAEDICDHTTTTT